MKRLIALMRETWWLWVIFFGSGVVLTLWVDDVFVITFPIYAFTLIYFAFIRFDEEGNRRDL